MATNSVPDMTCIPELKPPIASAVINTLHVVENLERIATELIERLEPIANPQPSTEGTTGVDTPALGNSIMFLNVQEIADRVHQVNKRLERLILNLEV